MSSYRQKLLLGVGLAAGIAALVGWQLCFRILPVARYQRLLAGAGEKLDEASPATKSESFGWQQGRDLVWPQPATAEQVRLYWEKKTKRRH
jgi:hypothetical protein